MKRNHRRGRPTAGHDEPSGVIHFKSYSVTAIPSLIILFVLFFIEYIYLFVCKNSPERRINTAETPFNTD